MRFTFDDFQPGIDPKLPFKSQLPGTNYLRNTPLDPGLGFGDQAVLGELGTLQRVTARLATENLLRLQQLMAFDMAVHVGVLQRYAPAVSEVLRGFTLTFNTLSSDDISNYVKIKTPIGAVAGALSAVPTIYTQLIGGIVGFAIAIADMIHNAQQKKLPTPPRWALPLQVEDDATDDDQVQVRIRGVAMQSKDWTSLFAPRNGTISAGAWNGALTAQFRQDQGGAGLWGLAWGMGDGTFSKEGSELPELWATGGVGGIPGGEQIYSIFQTVFMEPRVAQTKAHPTFYDPRCGSCMYSGGVKVEARDVGRFYPNTAAACVTAWDWAQQLGPAMFTIDTVKLESWWQSYFEAVWEGIERAWRNASFEDYWGCSVWECALQEFAARHSAPNDVIGGFGAWAPQRDGKLRVEDRVSFFKASVLERIIRPALVRLRVMQMWYLQNTTVAAYLPAEDGPLGSFADPLVKTAFEEARWRMLEPGNPEKHQVRLDEVEDEGFRKALESAGGGTKGAFAATPPGGAATGHRARPRPPEVEPESTKGGPAFPIPEGDSDSSPGIGTAVAGAVALGGLLWGASKLKGRRRPRL